ncbi:MAG: DUF262 domain-containing protein [Cyanobacterium sp. T60_A2020_053]|nr:DUF262 domain-containing protein [Cyanobacterium sp. T60_A2020_053]
MKANETKIQNFLSLTKTQFVIPVYQRNYDWSIPQCKQLLDDILSVGKNSEMNAHFIGSIVFIHDDVYTASRTKELSIIDGQQRLTTLALIYLVIYRLALNFNDLELASEINETYLINKFVSEEDKLKLKLTEPNSNALKYLLKGDFQKKFNEYSRIVDNFNYFNQRINEENYQVVIDGLNKLIFVEISLERGKDDPQRIFESLNSTGLDLSQADLIRNYILMGLKLKEQRKVYENYWLTIEKLARDDIHNISKVSDFIRDYLTLTDKNIPNKNKVYISFKSKYSNLNLETLEKELSNIKSLAHFYNKLINPQREEDKDIRNQLECLKRLETNVTHPFLMQVYYDYKYSTIDKKTFLAILDLIQSFIWRRFIIGLPTNSLNKIFMSLYDKVDLNNYLISIQKTLIQRTGSQRFPQNNEVLDALKFKDMYNIQSKNRTYFLERLENYNNPEIVIIDEKITIEHIFPQNPDSQWKKDLGIEEFNYIKSNYLHTIANLTLSGHNNSLKNKSFLAKRDMIDSGYKYSRLWLNKYISQLDIWNQQELEKRFQLISKRFLSIWQYPDIKIEEIKEIEEFNIFEADDPKYKKLDYAIFCDEKIEIKEVSKLYAEIFKRLFEKQPELFFTTDLGEKVKISKKNEKHNVRQQLMINETYFIEGNLDNSAKFERIKYALSLFRLEEELIIKYSD